MHINIVSPGTGFDWLELGYRTFRRQPLAWILLFSFVFAVSFLLGFIPWAGPALNWALAPLMWLLTMTTATQVDGGQRLRPAAILAALRGPRDRWYAVLALCVLCPIAILAPLMLAMLIDGNGLAGYMLTMNSTAAQPAISPQDQWLLYCWFAWMGALTPAFSFASGLTLWHGIAPLQALRLGMGAWLRNWRAFAVFWLSALGILVVLMAVATLVLFAPAMLSAATPSVGLPLLIVAAVGFLSIMGVWMMSASASQAFMLRDCFSNPLALPTEPSGTGLNTA